MSRENVELLRRWLWAFENDTAAFRGLLHPEIEWFPFEENRTPVHGVADAVRNRNEWLATWDEHRFDLEEVIEQRDSVIALIHITARGKTSGAKVDVRFHAQFKVRDGRVVYIFDHPNRAAALQAAALQE